MNVWQGPGIAGLSDFHLIGRGGSALVYRAWQESVRRWVAVKLLSADLSDPRDARHFARECALLGRLGSHPHVVDIYDAGVAEDGRPYIVMPYYAKGSLADRIAQGGPLPVGESVDVLCSVADALEVAHAQNVVHRDIKPQNLMVADDDSVVLADFGISAQHAEDESDSSLWAFTEAYAAPEVLENNAYTVASDVYSLAATGYALLSGADPFAEVTGARRVAAIVSGERPRISRPGVGADLRTVIEEAMSTDPASRPRSAAEFAGRLREAQDGEVTQVRAPVAGGHDVLPESRFCIECGARLAVPGGLCQECGAGGSEQPHLAGTMPADVPEPVSRPASGPPARNWWPAVVLACVALVVVAVIVWLLQGTPTASQAPSPGPTVTTTAQPDATVTVTAEPDGQDTPQPPPPVTAPAGYRSCGQGVYGNAKTSCPFALTVADEWRTYGGPVLYDVYSSVTDKYYDLQCSGNGPVVCEGGVGASVWIRE